jgi:hypothetical protein
MNPYLDSLYEYLRSDVARIVSSYIQHTYCVCCKSMYLGSACPLHADSFSYTLCASLTFCKTLKMNAYCFETHHEDDVELLNFLNNGVILKPCSKNHIVLGYDTCDTSLFKKNIHAKTRILVSGEEWHFNFA